LEASRRHDDDGDYDDDEFKTRQQSFSAAGKVTASPMDSNGL